MLYGNISEKCTEVIREVCSANYVDIISGNVSSEHVHMLISVPPHPLILKIGQYIKREGSRKLQGEFHELKQTVPGTTSVGERVFCRNVRTDKGKEGTKTYREIRRI